MEYQDALRYILSLTDYEKSPAILYTPARFDLRRVEELLSRLGNPHLKGFSVHIAGTKGKGSTAAIIASILNEAGYKTGLYTSPHLHSFTERIMVNGRPILREEFGRLVETIRPEVEGVNRRAAYGRLTVFEVLTALAFLYFQREGCELRVLEVGMGGRLDATNVVRPSVCIITSISYDHVDVLGHTLAQIAWEKAGIVKPGVPVVSSPQSEEAAAAIEGVCRERGAKLTVVGRDYTWKRLAADLSGQSFQIQNGEEVRTLRLPLLGEHQIENATAALAALLELRTQRVQVPERCIESGMARVQWSGRLEVLKQEPLWVADGAHNGDSMRRLAEALTQHFEFSRLLVLMGTSMDKDIMDMAKELVPLKPIIIATRSRHARAASPEKIAEVFQKLGMLVQKTDSVAGAVALAEAQAAPRDLVCATGSLFVVAEVIENVRGFAPELYPF